MKPPELMKWKISKLHHLLLKRCFAVPKLQRNFVWDAGRAAKLLDSIYRDMPIGSIFLWEMDRKSANLIRQSAEVLPSFYNGNTKIWFVIDGQQRLSVIHQAFEGQVRANDAGRDIDFGRLCFLVHPDLEQDFPPRIVYRKPVDREIVPIHDILSPDWKRRMPSQAKSFLAKARTCREQLLKYEVPVVVIRSATLTRSERFSFVSTLRACGLLLRIAPSHSWGSLMSARWLKNSDKRFAMMFLQSGN